MLSSQEEEQDCSSSSTQLVWRAAKEAVPSSKTTPPLSPNGVTDHKRVRFSDQSPMIYTYDDAVDDNAMWYSLEEMEIFKRKAKIATAQIMRVEHERNADPKSYYQVFRRVYTAGCKNSFEGTEVNKSDLKYFQRWVSVTASRLGLERLSVSCIHQDALIRRRELTETILEVQQELVPQSVKVDLLRKASCEISRPSVAFAAHLGRCQST